MGFPSLSSGRRIFVHEEDLIVCSKVLITLNGGGIAGRDILLCSCNLLINPSGEKHAALSNPPWSYNQARVDRNTCAKV